MWPFVSSFFHLVFVLEVLPCCNMYQYFIHFLKNIYFWLRWVLVAAHGIFRCGTWVFSLELWHTGSRACGLCSCSAGSLVVPHGLSSCGVRLRCPAACGILVPWPALKPASPALEGRFSTTGPPGKSPLHSFLRRNNIPLYEYTTICLSVFCCWTFRLFPPFGYCK